MTDIKSWSPIDLSKYQQDALDAFKIDAQNTVYKLDNHLLDETSLKIAQALKPHIKDIVERDGMPHLCHLINGWGNAVVDNKPLVSHLRSFMQKNNNGEYFFSQCDAEGDFHPWQTFAYAIMAGVDPDINLYDNDTQIVTLKTLASNSRVINTSEGRELGHLLFALAYIDPDLNTKHFILNGARYSIEELVNMAIYAHEYGSFEVCRKFHLTEGLCAISRKIPGLNNYTEIAQIFLDGQMDILLLIAMLLKEIRTSVDTKQAIVNNPIIQGLREDLRIGHLIENHIYYAGHLIELACFAKSLGYKIGALHHKAITYITNELNFILQSYLEFLSIPDCFLTLGHYRRGITLWQIIENSSYDNLVFNNEMLAKFTVNFDTLPLIKATSSLKPLSVKDGGIFNITRTIEEPRKKFLETLNELEKLIGDKFKLRGKFIHFRRISPPTWPRAFHYEILDYGEEIGIEIHLESESVLPMRRHVLGLEKKIKDMFNDHFVEWDPRWYKGCGRLRVVFANNVTPIKIAEYSNAFIRETMQILDPFASLLEVNQMNLQRAIA